MRRVMVEPRMAKYATHKLSIPRTVFKTLMRSIMANLKRKPTRFNNTAIQILHAETEQYLTDIFELTTKLSPGHTLDLKQLTAAVSVYHDLVQPCL